MSKHRIHQIITFTRAIIAHIKRGQGYLPEEQVLARFEICKTCDQFNGKKCRACGCCLDAKTKFLNKLSYPLEACPLGKWPAITSEDSASGG